MDSNELERTREEFSTRVSVICLDILKNTNKALSWYSVCRWQWNQPSPGNKSELWPLELICSVKRDSTFWLSWKVCYNAITDTYRAIQRTLVGFSYHILRSWIFGRHNRREFFGEHSDSSCSIKTCYHAAVIASTVQQNPCFIAYKNFNTLPNYCCPGVLYHYIRHIFKLATSTSDSVLHMAAATEGETGSLLFKPLQLEKIWGRL
jgi:hypothetical protein